MKRAMLFVAAVVLPLSVLSVLVPDGQAVGFAVGGLGILAGVIALTFYWLWRDCATPLALGMAISWTGSAGLMAWLWAAAGRGLAADGQEGVTWLSAVIAVQIIGALLHFDVIAASLGLARRIWIGPLAGVSLMVPLIAQLLRAF